MGDPACVSVGASCSAPPVLAATQAAIPLRAPRLRGGSTGSCHLGVTGEGSALQYSVAATGGLRLELTSPAIRASTSARIATTRRPASPAGENRGGTNEILYLGAFQGDALSVFVDGDTTTRQRSYTLTSAFTPITLTEAEPNDTSATANVALLQNVGMIEVGESDWYSVIVPGPASSITAETVNPLGAAGMCESNTADTFIRIYDADGTTVLESNDDAGAGFCSLATEAMLAAGTYYVEVLWAPSVVNQIQTAYQLNVTATP